MNAFASESSLARFGLVFGLARVGEDYLVCLSSDPQMNTMGNERENSLPETELAIEYGCAGSSGLPFGESVRWGVLEFNFA